MPTFDYALVLPKITESATVEVLDISKFVYKTI
jgi:hypothetical protein